MKTRIAALFAILAGCTMLVGTPLFAAVNWDGSDAANNTNWSNASNWVGDVAPSTGPVFDDVVFNSTNFDPGWTTRNVTVAFGDSAETLTFQGATASAAVSLVPLSFSEILDVTAPPRSPTRRPATRSTSATARGI